MAEKSSYNLIPASAACELLKNTDVKCLAATVPPAVNVSSKPTPKKAVETNNTGGERGFPLWIIYAIAGLLLVAFIIMLVVIRRKGRKAREKVQYMRLVCVKIWK